jgi:hypothetical protein
MPRRYTGRHVAAARAPFITGYAAAATTLVTVLFLGGTQSGIPVIAVVIAAACALAFMAAWLVRNAAARTRQSGSADLRKSLLAQLTPVICLSLAFPLVDQPLRTTRVGSVTEAGLVLAASLTTPWLSQVVCTPLFTALSAAPADGDPESLWSRWLSRWPAVAIPSVPVAATFGAGIGLALRWGATATGSLVLLCTLSALFSQTMVVGILRRNYLPWAAAWLTYAVVLVTLPRLWFLPPIAGMITQLCYLLAGRHPFARPVWTRGLLTQFVKGTVVGAVLWSDKLFYFLRATSHFNARFAFMAVLPAVVTYGYYFVRLAPRLDQIVAEMRSSMENDSMASATARLRGLADQVEESIVSVVCVGAVLCLLSVIAVGVLAPAESRLYAAMAGASAIFLLLTVLLYLLDYVGRTDLVFGFAGAQLLVVALVIGVGGVGPLTYLVLAALSALLAGCAARSVLSAWRVPEYSLFWRYATEW